jgi:hydroxymethylpyrimidine/phosphomethylpyrimidine kinase
MRIQGKYPAALTVAGSDSSGGAGIQADLKTFAALGVYGASVITALTAQNTTGVRAIEIISPEMIRLQAEAVLDDIGVTAVKTGMLPTVETIEAVVAFVDRYRIQALVADPVMVATTGSRLVSEDAVLYIRRELFRRVALITPNISEASLLAGVEITGVRDFHKAAGVLMDGGCKAVLIKGGHLHGKVATDILFRQDAPPVELSSEYVETQNTHGTGCTFSAAVTAFLALGETLEKAVFGAKEYITEAIRAGAAVQTGNGNGPVNHFFQPQTSKIIPL